MPENTNWGASNAAKQWEPHSLARSELYAGYSWGAGAPFSTKAGWMQSTIHLNGA